MSMPSKCQFSKRPMSRYEREQGCPLDHCSCGTHDSDQLTHTCPDPSAEDDGDAENGPRGADRYGDKHCTSGPHSDESNTGPSAEQIHNLFKFIKL